MSIALGVPYKIKFLLLICISQSTVSETTIIPAIAKLGADATVYCTHNTYWWSVNGTQVYPDQDATANHTAKYTAIHSEDISFDSENYPYHTDSSCVSTASEKLIISQISDKSRLETCRNSRMIVRNISLSDYYSVFSCSKSSQTNALLMVSPEKPTIWYRNVVPTNRYNYNDKHDAVFRCIGSGPIKWFVSTSNRTKSAIPLAGWYSMFKSWAPTALHSTAYSATKSLLFESVLLVNSQQGIVAEMFVFCGASEEQGDAVLVGSLNLVFYIYNSQLWSRYDRGILEDCTSYILSLMGAMFGIASIVALIRARVLGRVYYCCCSTLALFMVEHQIGTSNVQYLPLHQANAVINNEGGLDSD